MIQEVIVTTRSAAGVEQIAPMGIHREDDFLVIKPFRPSTTLDNLLETRCAAVNYTDDVRVFAGCLTGRYDWPLGDCGAVAAPRLRDSLAHSEVELDHQVDDALRPRLYCRVVAEATHAPFQGFNRAQAAVLELAILVSRLDRLPREKIESEIEYLRIAIDKTAGEREREAWDWLMCKAAGALNPPAPA